MLIQNVLKERIDFFSLDVHCDRLASGGRNSYGLGSLELITFFFTIKRIRKGWGMGAA